MQNGDPQMARWQWIRDVMKITPIPGNDINLESSEHSSIGQYFSGLFDLDMIRYCNWCKKEFRKPFFPASRVCATIEEHLQGVNNVTAVGQHSRSCIGKETELYYEFKNKTPLVLYRIEIDLGELGGGISTALREQDVPHEITVLHVNYKLFALTMCKPSLSKNGIAHYIAIFYTPEGKFEYDGLKQGLRLIKTAIRNCYATCAYYVQV
jgi:hypothetical protein